MDAYWMKVFTKQVTGKEMDENGLKICKGSGHLQALKAKKTCFFIIYKFSLKYMALSSLVLKLLVILISLLKRKEDKQDGKE